MLITRLLCRASLASCAMLLAACSGRSAIPAPVQPGIEQAVQFQVLDSPGFVTRIGVNVLGTRAVMASFESEPPLEVRLPPGLSGPYELGYSRERGWVEPPLLTARLRFADAGAPVPREHVMQLARTLPQLDDNAVYLLPLQTEAAVGDEVRLLVLQGEPASPLDSLELTLDCGGPVEYVADSLRLELDGAWAAPRSGSVLPLALGNSLGVDASLASSGRLHVSIGPGFHSIGSTVPPNKAHAGGLFTLAVRYTAPGRYRPSLPASPGDSYFTDSNFVAQGERVDWQSFGLPPGVSSEIIID